jgi:hypothetical protein
MARAPAGALVWTLLIRPQDGLAAVADDRADDGDRLVDVGAAASSAGGGKCLPLSCRRVRDDGSRSLALLEDADRVVVDVGVVVVVIVG